jgi:hypothetical protein
MTAVERKFAAAEWIMLSVEEQIRRCRLMAEEALTLASGDRTSVRQHYLDLAMQWLDVAKELQTQIGASSSRD